VIVIDASVTLDAMLSPGGLEALAQDGVRHRHHGDVEHVGMGQDEVFDLFGGDLFATLPL